MKYIAVIVLLLSSCSAFALDADLNNDCVVNFPDFAIFAADWLNSVPNISEPNTDFNGDGTVNAKDLAVFAGQWLNEACPPTVSDSNQSVVQYVVYSFELEADSDDDFAVHINSKPDGIIKDPFVGAKIIEANDLPWQLRRAGTHILYTSDAVGSDSFNWYASNSNGSSGLATVNITVTPNPRDGLYLNGEPNSFIEIPDNNYFDITDSGWAVSFWFNNYWRKPYINPLISKRSGTAGWKVSIMAGKLQFDLYDANGTNVNSFRTNLNISDGQWHPILIEYIYDANEQYILIYNNEDSDSSNTAGGNFANDANLLIAGNSGIDHLRFWDDIDRDDPLWPPDARDDYTESVVGIGNESNVRYKMDEAAGAAIADDKGNAGNGTFDPNFVIWHPPYGIFKNLIKHYQ